MFPDIGTRSLRQEAMDRPDVPASALNQALAGLARVHHSSLTVPYLGGEILSWANRVSLSSLRILDIACGGGDVLRGLVRHLSERGISVVGTGVDANPACLDYARVRSPESLNFICADARDARFARHDICMCTFFLHHLTVREAVPFLKTMKDSSDGLVLVYDLLRSRTGYLLAWAGSRLLSRSPIVHTDALLSVRAAFTPDELRLVAERAGLTGARIERAPAARALVAWERHPAEPVTKRSEV